ncbi:MAG: carboxypeptidase regulatory-like domain-containing protein [Bacteroidales bacterium]|jgi:PKD repeat protein|nr:carboxypeptidase regulatory-like domain-containing protein [Bacteroidales bacterium]
MKLPFAFLLFFLYLAFSSADAQVVQTAKNDELSVSSLFSGKTERYFRFLIHDKKEIGKLTKIIPIDNVKGDTVWAYANRKQFAAFVTLGYDYKILPNPGELIHPLMVNKINLKDRNNWDYYPTYTAYLDLMSQFQANYPALCKIDTIGVTTDGRLLLAAKISDNVNTDEGEPEFLYTSSMHGDETTGYVLMLHLMDYLLTNYGIDSRVTNMVNNTEIWINPLANPDGTYMGGNNTVFGATRGNANGVDLNRNYPDPEDGPHPDGEVWQAETQAFMNFAGLHHFVMSANFHGGAEVFNYPWDTWAKLHPDNNWWIFTGRQFADTVHVHSGGGYMTDLNNGITNGYAWYEVNGGRQDYMNYFWHCREVTIELSSTKILPANQLVSHWNYNYRSFLNYIDQSRYGIQGVVTDSLTGNPLHAQVFIVGHDFDSSQVYSSALNGDYHRPIKTGNYTLTFSASCYHPKTIQNVSVTDLSTTVLNVQLQSFGGLNPDFTANKVNVTFGEPVHFTDLSCGSPVSWEWIFEGGTPATSTDPNPVVNYSAAGTYDVSLTISDGVNAQSLLKQDYITVAQNIIMANGSITTCTGNFFDSGGPDNNYSNNENKVMTINAATPGAMLKVSFSQFETESEYDYLYIYNGTTVTAPQITGSPFSGTTNPGVITASNASGALTFKFTSDGSVTKTGWEATIECEGGSIGHVISGTITYPNTGNTPMNNIPVKLKNASGTVIATVATNVSGSYSFTEVTDGNYTLEASTDKPWEGVTAGDVLLFRKHIANIAPLYGIYLACGDVNGSGSLTASDVLLIKKRIITLINSFPVGDWLFNNLPVIVNGNDVTQNFNGIIYGDANASYIWTNADTPGLTTDPLNLVKSNTGSTITLGSANVATQGQVILPLNVSSIQNLGAFQFSIQYDPTKLSFVEATHWYPGIDEVLVANPQPGSVTFIWAADVQGISISGDRLCQLVFNPVSTGRPEISWSGNPIPCEWYDFDVNKLEIGMLKTTVDNETGMNDQMEDDVRIYPNPGAGMFTLSLKTPGNTNAEIVVYNALGLQVARLIATDFSKPETTQINLSDLPNGVYFLQIQTERGKITRKVVIEK